MLCTFCHLVEQHSPKVPAPYRPPTAIKPRPWLVKDRCSIKCLCYTYLVFFFLVSIRLNWRTHTAPVEDDCMQMWLKSGKSPLRSRTALTGPLYVLAGESGELREGGGGDCWTNAPHVDLQWQSLPIPACFFSPQDTWAMRVRGSRNSLKSDRRAPFSLLTGGAERRFFLFFFFFTHSPLHRGPIGGTPRLCLLHSVRDILTEQHKTLSIGYLLHLEEAFFFSNPV